MSPSSNQSLRVTAISGGVGGAKLADGLAQVLDVGELMIVTNTGDDFDHLGLRICPDLDSVMYALGGLSDETRGWGRADETWNCMSALSELGAADWFALGDRDLATHIHRSHQLSQGVSLEAVTSAILERLGVRHRVVPMTESHVATRLSTSIGWLEFQHYFVREQCKPVVNALEYAGASDAQPVDALKSFRAGEGNQVVVLCPSNPFLSIDPVLAVAGMRELLAGSPVLAVSPIIGGEALKGPAAKLMRELGFEASSLGIARYYRDLVDILVIDDQDAAAADAIRSEGMEVVVTNTVMRDRDDRRQLAATVVDAARCWQT